MLRPYFRCDRDLLEDLCRVAHECLIEFLRTSLGLSEGVPGIVMAIDTFGEYLDFHPHLHALVADGLFARSGVFHVLPEVSLKPVEELFRARVITFLVNGPTADGTGKCCAARCIPDSTCTAAAVQPDEREDLERLAQYIIRNLFSGQKMQVNQPGGSIIYQSGMSEKIHRNLEVFSPCDFIAAIAQHIPDKSFQLVRYYGWYHNKMRGQRDKQAAETPRPQARPSR